MDNHGTSGWLEDALKEIDDAYMMRAVMPDPPPPAHPEIHARVSAYGQRVHFWLIEQGPQRRREVVHPLSIIGWFSHVIPSSLARAESGPMDHSALRPSVDSSVKVAVIGIERSLAAWRDLLSIGHISAEDAAPFLTDLTELLHALASVFPTACALARFPAE